MNIHIELPAVQVRLIRYILEGQCVRNPKRILQFLKRIHKVGWIECNTDGINRVIMLSYED